LQPKYHSVYQHSGARGQTVTTVTNRQGYVAVMRDVLLNGNPLP